MKRAILAPREAVPDDSFAAWPGRSVPVDGLRTHVRDIPATRPGAEPALYVHGLGGSAQNWTDLAGQLSPRLAGQAIDLPGFGHSDPGPSFTIAAYAQRVIRWIEHADRGPVHLIGNSLGGTVAVRVAGCRPDLIRSLTLISPAMPFLDPRRSLQGRMLPLLAMPGAELIAARLLSRIAPEEMARQVIEACFADPSRLAERRRAEALEEIQLRYTMKHYPTVYLRTLRGIVLTFLRAYLPGANSLWRVAARIAAPTLVIGGYADRLVDVRVSPQVARTIPDSRLMMLRGVGHVAQMEVPNTVARAIWTLLDEVAAGREAGAERAPAVGPAFGGAAAERDMAG